MFNSNCGGGYGGYSLADIAAATGGRNSNSGWGGDGSAWWIIILFLFVFCGWDGNGFGGGFGRGQNSGGGIMSAATQGALTREQACIDNNFQNLMRETAAISDAVGVGFANLNSTICNQQYDTAQMVNGLNNTIQNGFYAANTVALQNQNALQSQLANCCCDLRTGQAQIGNQIERASCDTNYNAATNTTAIIQNAHNDTDRILARLDAMESARKDETIADLRTQLASCGDQTTAQYIINQVRGIVSPTPVPAYPAASPCGLGNWSQNVLANGGCGCNCGAGFGYAVA